MYCVKCGVELADSERTCPLCSTPVYMPGLDPDPERPYPQGARPEVVNARGVYFVITFAFVIAAIICLVADMSIERGIEWSGFVIGGLIVSYVAIILPGWFNHRHPDVFVPSCFVAAGAYLAYISFATGGEWFLTFALPLVGGLALIVSAVAILTFYLRRGMLYIWGGAVIAVGLLCILLEWLTVVTFDAPSMFVWSLYPAITLTLVGLMLIIVAIVRPFRESLRKVFFIG